MDPVNTSMWQGGSAIYHIVCGWRGEEVAIITVYAPGLPKFIDPWTEGKHLNENETL
jgi:hypothetical protein